MEEILKAVSQVGFPIAVTVYILVRMETKMTKLTDVIKELLPLIKEDTDNTKEIKEAINSLKLEIAKINGKKWVFILLKTLNMWNFMI